METTLGNTDAATAVTGLVGLLVTTGAVGSEIVGLRPEESVALSRSALPATPPSAPTSKHAPISSASTAVRPFLRPWLSTAEYGVGHPGPSGCANCPGYEGCPG